MTGRRWQSLKQAESEACAKLEEMRAGYGEKQDGFAEYAAEIIKAVEQLKSLEWEDIRKERFNMTPTALFADLVNIAESLLHRQAAEMRLHLFLL